MFTREGQPACMQGFFQAVVSQYEAHEKAVDTFKSGKGRPWSDQSSCCFCGTDRFFRPGYAANLVESWIPALDGVEEKLKAGAKVADIGCGHGSSTVLMAQAYPKSTITGFDFHAPSIEEARAKAAGAGVKNVQFDVATAQGFPGRRLRPRLHLRRAARHGRSGRRGASHPRDAGARRMLHAGGADGGRHDDREHAIRSVRSSMALDHRLHAGLAGAGGRPGAWRASWPETPDRSAATRRGSPAVRRAAETPTNMVLEVRA